MEFVPTVRRRNPFLGMKSLLGVALRYLFCLVLTALNHIGHTRLPTIMINDDAPLDGRFALQTFILHFCGNPTAPNLGLKSSPIDLDYILHNVAVTNQLPGFTEMPNDASNAPSELALHATESENESDDESETESVIFIYDNDSVSCSTNSAAKPYQVDESDYILYDELEIWKCSWKRAKAASKASSSWTSFGRTQVEAYSPLSGIYECNYIRGDANDADNLVYVTQCEAEHLICSSSCLMDACLAAELVMSSSDTLDMIANLLPCHKLDRALTSSDAAKEDRSETGVVFVYQNYDQNSDDTLSSSPFDKDPKTGMQKFEQGSSSPPVDLKRETFKLTLRSHYYQRCLSRKPQCRLMRQMSNIWGPP
jgi:hypothetical protein